MITCVSSSLCRVYYSVHAAFKTNDLVKDKIVNFFPTYIIIAK